MCLFYVGFKIADSTYIKLVGSGLAILRGLMIIGGIVAAIIVVSNFSIFGICALKFPRITYFTRDIVVWVLFYQRGDKPV